ncbi:hypothetical protein GS928_19240 [Rhodococcus hoagii]|nr:hypothetical protein [Prescottella equi]
MRQPIDTTLRWPDPMSPRRIYTYTVAIVMSCRPGLPLQHLGGTPDRRTRRVGDLIFALLHSLSHGRSRAVRPSRAAAPLLLWYSIGTEQGWAAVLGFAGVLFGITTAATNTRVLGLVVDGSAVSHHLQDVDEALNAVDGSSSRGRHARNEE